MLLLLHFHYVRHELNTRYDWKTKLDPNFKLNNLKQTYINLTFTS
jgi:hypothetical protein